MNIFESRFNMIRWRTWRALQFRRTWAPSWQQQPTCHSWCPGCVGNATRESSEREGSRDSWQPDVARLCQYLHEV